MSPDNIVVTKDEAPATIVLPARKARMLTALTKVVNWDAQLPEVAAFLAELEDELAWLGYHGEPEDFGFVVPDEDADVTRAMRIAAGEL